MSIKTDQAFVTCQAHRDMMHALGEGTLGRAFKAFSLDDPKGTIRVVRVALTFWAISEYNPAFRAERNMPAHKCDLVGIGAYAHNFTEIVAEMAEEHLPPMVNHFGHTAWMGRMGLVRLKRRTYGEVGHI